MLARRRAGWWVMGLLILLLGVLLLFLLNPRTEDENIPIPTVAPTVVIQLPTSSLTPTPLPTSSLTPIPSPTPPPPTAIPPLPTQIPATRVLPPQPAPVEIALGGQALWGEGIPPIYGRFGGLYDNQTLVQAGHVMIAVPPQEFYIDTFEVTNQQFVHFLNATQLTDFPLETSEWVSATADIRQNREGIWELKALRWGNLPVRGISPWAARAYCANWGGKLPNWAQWQLAAFWDESPTLRSYPWGEASPDHERVHFGADEPTLPTDFPNGRSWVGAYQLAGNVAEWLELGEGDFAFVGGSFADDALGLLQGLTEPRFSNQPQAEVGFRCVLAD